MPPRPKKPSEKTAINNTLLNAVNFLSSILKDEGSPFETHILLKNKTVTAFNGTIAAGALIDEELFCAPHNKTFLSALQKCKDGYSLTQIDQGKLSIKSGKFKAIVPCIDPNVLPYPVPDVSVAPIDDRFKAALTIIEKVKSDGEQIYDVSFLMNGGSVIATDGKIIFECWHGLDLPPALPLPKAFISTIIDHPRKLLGFGFSRSSCTFYFDDNSWVRSQLYAKEWPSISHILNKPNNAVSVPTDFFTGLESIAPFSDGPIYFNNGLLRTHKEEGKGASYEISELKEGPIFSLKYLKMIENIATKIDFYVEGKMLAFYGDNVRGMIMGHG